jgi:hypothetical protein
MDPYLRISLRRCVFFDEDRPEKYRLGDFRVSGIIFCLFNNMNARALISQDLAVLSLDGANKGKIDKARIDAVIKIFENPDFIASSKEHGEQDIKDAEGAGPFPDILHIGDYVVVGPAWKDEWTNTILARNRDMVGQVFWHRAATNPDQYLIRWSNGRIDMFVYKAGRHEIVPAPPAVAASAARTALGVRMKAGGRRTVRRRFRKNLRTRRSRK